MEVSNRDSWAKDPLLLSHRPALGLLCVSSLRKACQGIGDLHRLSESVRSLHRIVRSVHGVSSLFASSVG